MAAGAPTAGTWYDGLRYWWSGSSVKLYMTVQSPKLPIGVVCGSKAWCVTCFNRPVNVLAVFMAQ